MKFKKPLLFIILILLLAGGIVSFFALNSKPDTLPKAQKEKALGEMLGRKPNLSPQVIEGNFEYKGKHIAFTYPKAGKVYKGNAATFSFDLENPRIVFNFMEEDKRFDLQSLDDIPSVKLRKDPARGYSEHKLSVDARDGLAFTKSQSIQEGAEKSGYFLVDHNVYYFSVTGTSEKAVNDLFDSVVGSAHFN